MKKVWKIIIDVCMSIFFIIGMGYQLTGNKWHEIIGMLLFGFFIIHSFLNGFWYKNYSKIYKGTKKSLYHKTCFIIDHLVMIDMLILAITSILISRRDRKSVV